MFINYKELDRIGKLIWNFRNISHFLRSTSNGKGSQKHILSVLLKSGCVTQTALTDYLGISPGSASEVLSKMEAAKLIVRTENELDHRTVKIELTEKGKQEAILVTEERNRNHTKMFSKLSEKEQEELLFLLEKVTLHCEDNNVQEKKKE